MTNAVTNIPDDVIPNKNCMMQNTGKFGENAAPTPNEV